MTTSDVRVPPTTAFSAAPELTAGQPVQHMSFYPYNYDFSSSIDYTRTTWTNQTLQEQYQQQQQQQQQQRLQQQQQHQHQRQEIQLPESPQSPQPQATNERQLQLSQTQQSQQLQQKDEPQNQTQSLQLPKLPCKDFSQMSREEMTVLVNRLVAIRHSSLASSLSTPVFSSVSCIYRVSLLSLLSIYPIALHARNVAAGVVDSIWNYGFAGKLVSTRNFIQTILTRSKTTYVTLEISLFYLARVKTCVQDKLLRRASPPSPASSQDEDEQPVAKRRRIATRDRIEDYQCCGRRMFLAALITATKYLHDKNYKNSAWAKITGLSIDEVNASELAFLNLIDYTLFVSDHTYESWRKVLHEWMKPKSAKRSAEIIKGKD